MADNILIAVDSCSTDLTKPRFNHSVNRGLFQFNDDSFKYDYELVHQMSDKNEVCCRAAFGLLSVRMVYVQRHIDLTKTANHEFDKYVDSEMMDGLTDDNKFQDVRIKGAIVRPLSQSNHRMVSTGLCTETQYESVHLYFLDIVDICFEGGGEYPRFFLSVRNI